jgi:metal-responsive CopG/Arc/MetJ family transcriptional regulator
MTMARALVTLPDNLMGMIDSLKGTMGAGRSDIIRAIVTAWMSEKGYLRGDSKNGKK